MNSVDRLRLGCMGIGVLIIFIVAALSTNGFTSGPSAEEKHATATVIAQHTEVAVARVVASTTAVARQAVVARARVAASKTAVATQHATATAAPKATATARAVAIAHRKPTTFTLAQGQALARQRGSQLWFFNQDLLRVSVMDMADEQLNQDVSQNDNAGLVDHCSVLADNIGDGTASALRARDLTLPRIYQPYVQTVIQHAERIKSIGDSCKADAQNGDIPAVKGDYQQARKDVDAILAIERQLFPGQG